MVAPAKIRLGVLASGGGTNLQSIIDQSQNGQLDAEIVLVVSNNPNAGAPMIECPPCDVDYFAGGV